MRNELKFSILKFLKKLLFPDFIPRLLIDEKTKQTNQTANKNVSNEL